jgi:hypothetical protein
LRQGNRPLQPSGKSGQTWAAIPDESNGSTKFGLYDLRTFSFETLRVIPHLKFDSKSMWVDQVKGRIYIAYAGQLISLPLTNSTSSTLIK